MIQNDVGSLKSLVTLILTGAVVLAVLLLAPVLVGAYVTELGFGVQQAGYLISADGRHWFCYGTRALLAQPF